MSYYFACSMQPVPGPGQEQWQITHRQPGPDLCLGCCPGTAPKSQSQRFLRSILRFSPFTVFNVFMFKPNTDWGLVNPYTGGNIKGNYTFERDFFTN